jgi:hypothetical protein
MKDVIETSILRVKSWVFIALICLVSNIVSAQIAVVSYMKVEPGKWDTYLEVEEAWSKLHQKSVDNGYILAWHLNEKMFHGTQDSYDFVTVNVYADWATYEKGYPDGYFDQMGEEMLKKTGESRKVVRSEVFTMAVGAENSKPGKVMTIAFMKVKQGNSSAYVDMETKYYKVYHEALIEAGGLNSWGIYQRIVPFGFGGKYNYLAVNGFESLAQRSNRSDETIDAAWEKAAAGTSDDEINKITNDSRLMVSSVMWRNVMSVVSEPANE